MCSAENSLGRPTMQSYTPKPSPGTYLKSSAPAPRKQACRLLRATALSRLQGRLHGGQPMRCKPSLLSAMAGITQRLKAGIPRLFRGSGISAGQEHAPNAHLMQVLTPGHQCSRLAATLQAWVPAALAGRHVRALPACAVAGAGDRGWAVAALLAAAAGLQALLPPARLRPAGPAEHRMQLPRPSQVLPPRLLRLLHCAQRQQQWRLLPL